MLLFWSHSLAARLSVKPISQIANSVIISATSQARFTLHGSLQEVLGMESINCSQFQQQVVVEFLTIRFSNHIESYEGLLLNSQPSSQHCVFYQNPQQHSKSHIWEIPSSHIERVDCGVPLVVPFTHPKWLAAALPDIQSIHEPRTASSMSDLDP